MTGVFIVLEGGEGAGKSTQIAGLADRLRAQGRDVVVTFEPGATALGAEIRKLTHHFDGPLDARAEALLMAADRAQHVAAVEHGEGGVAVARREPSARGAAAGRVEEDAYQAA